MGILCTCMEYSQIVKTFDDNWTCDHLVMYKSIKSTCCTPETNIILYVKYNSIKKRKHISQDEESCSRDGD